jgi:hypothetical protein
MTARLLGSELAPAAAMFLTIVVVASVPSLFHSSTPSVPLSALKKSLPSNSVRLLGALPASEKLLTSSVVASVPSLFQSTPSLPSSTMK